ncbi:MAG TPA: hypothetical protein O0X39_07590 [Methanocorpusculum sp.]|nr:hypothetical protein [Methanocorpusculum sp.]
MITDVCIFAENSDTSVRRFALNAASCKFNRIIVAGQTICNTYAGVEILQGTLIPAESKCFSESLKKARGTVVLVEAGENSFNRIAVTAKNVRFLTGLSALPKHSFDDVIARSMSSRNVAAVFDLSKIIDAKTRRHALSHYAEVLKFARKFDFPCAIASGASSWLGQRTVSETVTLCSLFGMERSEVYQAMDVDKVLFPNDAVEVIE